MEYPKENINSDIAHERFVLGTCMYLRTNILLKFRNIFLVNGQEIMNLASLQKKKKLSRKVCYFSSILSRFKVSVFCLLFSRQTGKKYILMIIDFIKNIIYKILFPFILFYYLTKNIKQTCLHWMRWGEMCVLIGSLSNVSPFVSQTPS